MTQEEHKSGVTMQPKPDSGFTYGRSRTGFTYGRSRRSNYAIAVGRNRISGVWGACEVNGELYWALDFDEIPEDDWDRIEKLVERVTQSRVGRPKRIVAKRKAQA